MSMRTPCTLPAGRRRGFTLIELLVVIAIIGVLSSVVLASLNSARAKARDAQRLADARQIERALELYYDDNGAYPSTGGLAGNNWRGGAPNCYGGYGYGSNGFIPGLVPDYISTLPAEPRPSGTQKCYLYSSDGADYKFLIHQTMETCTAGSCPLQDPLRTTQQTSSIYTPAAKDI